jgi:hypothetical protein
MKGLLLSVVTVFLLAGWGLAQDVPRVELLAGYSYLRANPTGLPGVNTNGWEGSLAYNVSPHWALKGEFSGDYCCGGEHLHTFMGGPQWAWRVNDATVFVHGLVGGAHAQGAGIADTSIAWAAGGGIDWDFSRHFGWRAFQVDYVGTHFLGNTQSDFRVSTGLVFRFGRR